MLKYYVQLKGIYVFEKFFWILIQLQLNFEILHSWNIINVGYGNMSFSVFIIHGKFWRRWENNFPLTQCVCEIQYYYLSSCSFHLIFLGTHELEL